MCSRPRITDRAGRTTTRVRVTPLRYGADMEADRPNHVTVGLRNDTVRLDAFEVEDATVNGVLARVPAEARAETVRRMLGIGARSILETSVGVDLAAIDERVLASIEQSTQAAEVTVRELLSEAERSIRSNLDPDTRTSAMARALAEFSGVQASITGSVDPARADSHVAELLRSLTTMLGPGGELESRLRAAFDPATEDSGLASFRRDVDHRFTELRELLAEQRGRRDEAAAGTRKGFDFEDTLEDRLRLLARSRGAIVTRTSDRPGTISECLVGDFVLTLENGTTIVLEAKNSARVGLDGAGGILAELDRAMSNRDASIAICVSATDAFPTEVGTFGVYGNRVLVVDDGEGSMLEIAVRWASLLSTQAERSGGHIDVDSLREQTDRLRRLTRTFSTHRRALTDSIEAIGRVRDGYDELRRDVLLHIDEIEFELDRRPGTELRAVSGQ